MDEPMVAHWEYKSVAQKAFHSAVWRVGQLVGLLAEQMDEPQVARTDGSWAGMRVYSLAAHSVLHSVDSTVEHWEQHWAVRLVWHLAEKTEFRKAGYSASCLGGTKVAQKAGSWDDSKAVMKGGC